MYRHPRVLKVGSPHNLLDPRYRECRPVLPPLTITRAGVVRDSRPPSHQIGSASAARRNLVGSTESASFEWDVGVSGRRIAAAAGISPGPASMQRPAQSRILRGLPTMRCTEPHTKKPAVLIHDPPGVGVLAMDVRKNAI
jgi:hypothetical protein